VSNEQYDSEQAAQSDEMVAEVPPVGPLLRAAREARGESAHDVAAALKFSARQVIALEEERLHELPGPAFVKGFYRNYGRHVGVDVEPWIASRWSPAASGSVNLSPPTNANGTMPSSGGASGVGRAFGVLVAVLAVALVLGWYFDGFRLDEQGVTESRDAVAEREDPVPDVEVFEDEFGPAPLVSAESEPEQASTPQAAASAFAPITAPPAPRVESSTPVDVAPVGEVVESPVVRAEEPPAVVEAPPAPVARTEAAPPPAPVARTEAAPPPAPRPPEPAVVGTGSARLVFRLTADAWIQVRDADDRSLYSGTSRGGTTRVVQGDPPFWVTIGNATAVALEVDGSPVDLTPHMHTAGVARLVVE
jgi:cytoskeleton protein RodZ